MQLFVFNLIYFFILIIIFTDISQINKIIFPSLIIYLGCLSIFYFFLRRYNFCLNIPNQITLSRLVINIFIFVMILNIEIYNYTMLFILSFISIFLDGVDGYLSRYLNQTSKFGEIFDQEVDNFLILTLSISLIMNHNYFFYIIIIPFYRYIFQLLIQTGIISNNDLLGALMFDSELVLEILQLSTERCKKSNAMLSNMFSAIKAVNLNNVDHLEECIENMDQNFIGFDAIRNELRLLFERISD